MTKTERAVAWALQRAIRRADELVYMRDRCQDEQRARVYSDTVSCAILRDGIALALERLEEGEDPAKNGVVPDSGERER